LTNALPVLTPAQIPPYGFAVDVPTGMKFCYYATQSGKYSSYKYYLEPSNVDSLCPFLGGREYINSDGCSAKCRGVTTYADIGGLRACAAGSTMTGSLLKQFSPGNFVLTANNLWTNGNNGNYWCNQVFKHMVLEMTSAEYDFDYSEKTYSSVACTTRCDGAASSGTIEQCVSFMTSTWTPYTTAAPSPPGGVMVAPLGLWASTTDPNDLGVCLAPIIYKSQVIASSVSRALVDDLARRIGTVSGKQLCVYPAGTSVNAFNIKMKSHEYICKLRGGRLYSYTARTVAKRSNIHERSLIKRQDSAYLTFILAPFNYATLLSIFAQLKFFF